MTSAPPPESRGIVEHVRRRTRSLHLLDGSESGMALVVVLVVALAVAVVGVAMADNVVRETQIAANESSAVAARYLAEAGIADAAAHLSQDNTWQGPITQTAGAGTYTVQVDPQVSQLGALGAVKSVLSTGAAGSAAQTVRVTLLVLPQAFSKAMVSNTTITTVQVSGITPTVQNTVLRQLGTMHANNLGSAPTSVTLAGGTAATGQITASSGTISILGTCIACAPTDNLPALPFPTLNFTVYKNLAQSNTSPCTPGPGQDGTFFTGSTIDRVQSAFDTCIGAITPDSSGFRTITGVWYLNTSSLTFPNTAAEAHLKLYGALVVYNTTFQNCSRTSPCGDISFALQTGGNNITLTASNGEPAIMAGGNIRSQVSPGTLTINGLVYVLANTTNPATAAPVAPGFSLSGSSGAPVTINGMLVSNLIGSFNSNSLTYDPSSFFPGLPSGLNAPAGPFVLLPLSWSSGN